MIDALALWKQGHDTAAIADMMSTDEATIYNALAKARGQKFYRSREVRAQVRAYSDKLRRAGIKGHERNRAIVQYQAELLNG
mgnify:CR=1 FL=1